MIQSDKHRGCLMPYACRFKIPPKGTMRPSATEESRGVSGWGDAAAAEGSQRDGRGAQGVDEGAQGVDEGSQRQEVELAVTLLREGGPGGGCIASANTG